MVRRVAPDEYVDAIRSRGLSIYDSIEVGDPGLWIPSDDLEALLDKRLSGLNLDGLALRTRSKVVKCSICDALGYPVPRSFIKTQPRFPGQNFDVYTQKSNNLQIWNEELDAARRYVLVRPNDDSVIERVKVVTGADLALLDTTGTLTQKYQARYVPGAEEAELVSAIDTSALQPMVSSTTEIESQAAPTDYPDSLLPIADVFRRLQELVGRTFKDAGIDQERNRGGVLHRLVCEALGYSSWQDNGKFPDVRHQLIEVKLQTSPTIDLGLVSPDSEERLDIPAIGEVHPRHCDVRYVIFYGKTDGEEVTLTHLLVSTGRDFFSRCPQFQGKVLNAKLQIPLPAGFFAR